MHDLCFCDHLRARFLLLGVLGSMGAPLLDPGPFLASNHVSAVSKPVCSSPSATCTVIPSVQALHQVLNALLAHRCRPALSAYCTVSPFYPKLCEFL